MQLQTNLSQGQPKALALHRLLTIKSKLILLLVLTTIGAIATVTYISSQTQRTALTQVAFDQLVNRRNAHAAAVTSYMESLQNQIALLAGNRTVIDAATALGRAYNTLTVLENHPVKEEALRNYYSQLYLPALLEQTGADVALSTLFPTSPKSQFLQFHYVHRPSGLLALESNGPDRRETGKLETGKLETNSAEITQMDDSLYGLAHAQFDPQLQRLAAWLGVSDLLLIHYATEEVFYTTAGHPDLGTRLSDGPYRSTHLAAIVDQLKRSGNSGVQVVDFQAYPPSFGRPVAFLGTAITDPSDAPIALLIGELPPDRVDTIVTGEQTWQENGQGTSGETYIVGPDLLMRTTARFLVETPTAYIAELRVNGETEENIRTIERTNSTILAQPVESTAAREAVAGRSGIGMVLDYRGQNTLAAYAPLAIDGLTWGLITQIDTAEAFAPITSLQRRVFLMSTMLIFMVTVVALATSQLLTRPLRLLIEYIEQVQQGEFDGQLGLNARDEFGHVARSLSRVMQTYKEQTDLLARRNTENRALLHTLLPPAVAARIRRGEQQVVDTIHQTSIVCIIFVGFTTLLQQQGEMAATALMDRLIQAFDEAALRHELERQRSVGDSYVAVCGLDVTHLDHDKRAVNFALELFQALNHMNEECAVNLGLRVGIHSGTVVAGVLSGSKFMYNLWGAPLRAATTFVTQAERNTLLISDEVYNRLDQRQGYVRHSPIWVDEVGELAVWARLEQGRLTLHQIDLVQSSFAKCLPISEEVAEQFYHRLFELAPSARALFPTNMQEQQRKLMNTLNVAVGALNAPDKIIPILQKLGRGHVGYGATDDAYQVVGEALLWTLHVRLGDEFTVETREAWLAAYGWLSQVMISAAHEVESAEQADATQK